MKKYLVSILAVLVLFAGVGQVFADSGENDDGIKTFGQVLQEVGIIKEDGTDLHAKGHLTREQMVTIVNRLYREKAPENVVEFDPTEEYRTFTPPEKPTFADVPETHWAYKEVEFAYAKGILKKISGSNFGLGKKVNANETALSLIRIMGYDDEIMEEKINYKDAYRRVFLLLDIWGSHVKDPFAPLLRADFFQMAYGALWAKTPDGVKFAEEAFGYKDEMKWKSERILGGDRYCCYLEMHDIPPSDGNYYASFLPIFSTDEELFAGYSDFERNEITRTFDISFYDNLKSYLSDLNTTDGFQSWDYTNAALIKVLKRDNNIFVETINDITSGEMREISWDEFKNLVGDKVTFDLKMWTPHRDSKEEHTYLHPYNADGHVVIDTAKADFAFRYYRPAEEGMDGEDDTYSYEIKSIQVDKKTQSKFVFRIRIAEDQYQDVDLFFVFEYDSNNKKVVKAASCNTMGFGVINTEGFTTY